MKRMEDRSQDESLDRIIEQHFTDAAGELHPSSGFVGSVMQTLQTESAEPEPIRFPWRRVVPGIAVACLGLIVLCVLAVRTGGDGIAVTSQAFSIHLPPATGALAWALGAGLISLATAFLSLRWALRRG